MIAAGDFNSDLGGRHYYGTKEGRRLLTEGLERASLVCLTSTDRVPEGALAHPPIDHICVSRSVADRARVVHTWEGTHPSDGRLSDHSGMAVEVPSSTDLDEAHH